MEEQRFDIGETKEAYIQRMAAYAQTSEHVIRQAMRIKELEAAGELPKGTTQDIVAGKTTLRKVLNAYDKVSQTRKPAHLREYKITLTLTAEAINLLLEFADGAETEQHDAALRELLTLVFAQLRERFTKATRPVAT